VIPGRRYTIEDFARMGWRRRWLIAMPFVVVATLTIAVVSRLPERYRAETVIQIVPQRLSQEFVRVTVTERVPDKDRLSSAIQQIRSQPWLEQIVTELDFYREERRTTSLNAIVARLRDRLHVQTEGAQSLRLSFEAETPAVAVLVTQRLADRVIRENIRDREALAGETSAFLQKQLENARERLVEQEKRLEGYRLKYGSELPTQLQSNLQVTQNLQMQLQGIAEGLTRDRDRRAGLERQLADHQLEGAGSTLAAAGPPATAPAPSVEVSKAMRLDGARAELKDLETRLQPQHPDVAAARRRVDELEAEARQSASRPVPAPEPRPLSPVEQGRITRIKDIQAELASLDRQIEHKLDEERRLRASLDLYRTHIEAVPTRESELASLTRDYDTLQTLYRNLLAKREDSQVAENLERQQVGEQFKIVDPPRRPDKPSAPDRPRLDLAGAAGGLLLGLALTALFEFRDTRLRVDADVRAATSVPLLGVVPSIVTRRDRIRARWTSAAAAMAATALFAGCAAVVWKTFRL
jgi:protein tyrosine kinase modulator